MPILEYLKLKKVRPTKRGEMENALRGVRITSKHLKYEKKMTVHGVTDCNASQLQIEGLNKTVQQYFKEQYGINVRGEHLCLVTNTKNKTWMPLDVCSILGGSVRRNLDKEERQEELAKSCLAPQERLEEIVKVAKRARNDTVLTERAGLRIDPQPVRVNAEVLEPATVEFAANKLVKARTVRWNLQGFKMITPNPVPVQCYGIVVVGRKGDDVTTVQKTVERDFVDVFSKTYGLKFGNVRRAAFCTLVEDSRDASLLRKGVVDALKKCSGVQILFAVVPDEASARYEALKRVCDERTLPSQVLLRKNVLGRDEGGPSPQLVGNVALKVNLKLGGVNWKALQPRSVASAVDWQRTMLLGMDVTHAQPGSDAKSVVAVVASDANGSFYASVDDVAARHELVVDLQPMIVERLRKFKASHPQQRLPEKLVFFRDGVGLDQIVDVMDREIGGLHRAVADVYGQRAAPKLVFLLCTKRHHTRFFGIKKESTAAGELPEVENVQAGTLVKDTVTYGDAQSDKGVKSDFFLTSQDPLKGTSSPTHYIVLVDEVYTQDTDSLYRLCFSLAMNFQRATCSVSLPQPLYYAHLAAFRARVSLRAAGTAEEASQVKEKFSSMPNFWM